MEENDRGEEEANDGEVSRSQERVAVEDCDEDADVGAKQGEQNPCPVKSEPELGSPRTVAEEGVKKSRGSQGSLIGAYLQKETCMVYPVSSTVVEQLLDKDHSEED